MESLGFLNKGAMFADLRAQLMFTLYLITLFIQG